MNHESHPPSHVYCTPTVSTVATRSNAVLDTPGLKQLRAQTPARILTGHVGPAYRTSTWLELRRDHAAARDAVSRELDLAHDFEPTFIDEWGLFEVVTLARTKQEFLLRPNLGRSFSDPAKLDIVHRCPLSPDVQVAIADGLSATAVRVQIPLLLPLIASQTRMYGWWLGKPFLIRHGRVGILNEIGEILQPTVAILLIGERPGLATAESLSAYMAYRPRIDHDDARRNLISNIHVRGVMHEDAAHRIALLAAQMMQYRTSGVTIKEQWHGSLTLSGTSTFKITPNS
jgi:ethanolamine ammonia-lyase small subunit